MKLYVNSMSPNARRARIVAAHLALPVQDVVVDFTKGEHKKPEYLAINPNGAVPALVDGDFVLTESRAIMQYLASKKPESGLLPRDEQARAEVTRWQFWDSSHFSPQVGTFSFQRVLKPMFGMGDPDAAKIEEALTQFRRFAAVLDAHLASRRYVVGSGLTLADLTLACSLTYARQADVPIAEFPHLQSWFDGMTELGAWKQTQP